MTVMTKILTFLRFLKINVSAFDACPGHFPETKWWFCFCFVSFNSYGSFSGEKICRTPHALNCKILSVSFIFIIKFLLNNI